MFQVQHPFARTSTRIVLTYALAAALTAGPVASATASQTPEPSPTRIGWQATVNELAVEARGATSLRAHPMLHNEITMIMHSHHTW